MTFRNLSLIGFTILSVFSMASCDRKVYKLPIEEIAPTSATVYFNNNLATPVTLKVYTTKEDYNADNNAFINTVVQPGKAYYWHVDSSKKEVPYYYDWYTSDYSYNNWGLYSLQYYYSSIYYSNSLPNPISTPKNMPYYDHIIYLRGSDNYYQKDITININFEKKGNYMHLGRKFFINNTANSSHWVAVNVYKDNGVSQWNLLTDNQKYLDILFYKNMDCIYTTKDNNGNSITVKKTFESNCYNPADPTQGINATIWAPNGHDYQYIKNSNWNYPVIPKSYATDTLLMKTDTGFVVFRRQP